MSEGVSRALWGVLGLAAALHLPGVFAGPLADDPLRYAETWTPLSTALEWLVRPFPHTPGPLPADFGPKLYRPIWRLSYWLDGAVFGAPTPAAWVPSSWGTGELLGPRLVSIGLFLGVLLALHRLLRGRSETRPVATAAVGLVALHPLMVSPVAWLSARGGLLALLGLLLAGGQAQRGGRGVGLLVFLAAGSKETAMLAPLFVWLWSRRARPTATATVAAASVLGLRWMTLGTPFGGFDGLPTVGGAAWRVGLLGHLAHLAAPVPLAVVGPVVAVGIGGLLLALVGRGLRGPGRWVVLWLALALLPTFQLFAVPATGLHARLLAEAAVPACVAVALGLQSVPSRVRGPLLVLVGAVLAGASVERVFAHRAAAAQIRAARQLHQTHALPATDRGVVVGVNLEPWLSRAPWTEP